MSATSTPNRPSLEVVSYTLLLRRQPERPRWPKVILRWRCAVGTRSWLLGRRPSCSAPRCGARSPSRRVMRCSRSSTECRWTSRSWSSCSRARSWPGPTSTAPAPASRSLMLISTDELRTRMPPLRHRETALQSQLAALEAELLDAEAYIALTENLEGAMAKLHDAAQSLGITNRQRVLRLVVKDVRVGPETIVIRHSIPLPDHHPNPGYLLRPGHRDRRFRRIAMTHVEALHDVHSDTDPRLPGPPLGIPTWASNSTRAPLSTSFSCLARQFIERTQYTKAGVDCGRKALAWPRIATRCSACRPRWRSRRSSGRRRACCAAVATICARRTSTWLAGSRRRGDTAPTTTPGGNVIDARRRRPGVPRALERRPAPRRRTAPRG